MSKPVVYTLSHCPVCLALKKDWNSQGKDFEERQVDQNPNLKDEALKYGNTVPIVIFDSGQVQVGYKNQIG